MASVNTDTDVDEAWEAYVKQRKQIQERNLPWSLSRCLSYAKEHHRCLNFIRIKHDSRDILLGTVWEQDYDIA